MDSGARTPEELEALLEDAFVLRDASALAGLLDRDAVLATTGAAVPPPGGPRRAAGAMWRRGATYVGGDVRVIRAGGLALVVADGGVLVARRRRDGDWRLAIALLDPHTDTREEIP